MTELKKALQEKIAEFERSQTDPRYQSEIEQNAVSVVLRELRYLDSIIEFTPVTPESYSGAVDEKVFLDENHRIQPENELGRNSFKIPELG
jgi:hypothetical protein